ncbi:MAG: T9SS C-terminal target domain-containing protein, partial [Calditrichaeota bacterium]
VAAANDFVIIGSRGWARQRGKAYVFQQNAGGWSQVAELDRDASESNQGDLFGQAAAISPDYVLIGASHRNKSPGKEEPGVAYLYKRSNTGWTQYAKLMASDGSNGNNFGWSVAISDRYAVIGAPALPPVSHAPGAVYVYDLSTIVGIQESPETVPATFRLEQNYPNPFNPTTVIRYRIPAADHVELTIFNRLGEPVRTLVSERKAAGSYEIVWDGTDETGRRVASGVYLFRLSVGEQVQTKKMILMR